VDKQGPTLPRHGEQEEAAIDDASWAATHLNLSQADTPLRAGESSPLTTQELGKLLKLLGATST